MSRITSLWLFTNPIFAAHLEAQSVTHRWSFNSSGTAANGTIVADAISAAPGVVRGSGATRDGTQLNLPGTSDGNLTPAANSAYFDLPNGIISSKSNLTLEIWATVRSAQNWQRLFDFGQMNTTGNGEIIGTETTAANGTQARDSFMISPSREGFLDRQRYSARIDGGTEYQTDTSVVMVANTQYHFVATYQSGVGTFTATGGRISWYRNATLIGSVDVPFRLNQIEDVNNWLGRSQWSGDRNGHISYNEVRLYDYALTPAQVTASGTAGFDKIFPAPTAVADSITMHRGQKAKLNVLANDSGEIAVASLAIVQAPLSGTAKGFSQPVMT